MVEPPDPLEGGKLHVFQPAPRAAAPDHFRLEESDHRFSQGVVVAVSSAAHRGLDPGLGQPLGVANAEELRPASAMMDQAFGPSLRPLTDGLLQGIQSELRLQRARDPPAHDPAREDVDNEGYVHEATPGRHIGKIAHPELVRPLRGEVAPHQVQRPICNVRGNGGARRLPAYIPGPTAPSAVRWCSVRRRTPRD